MWVKPELNTNVIETGGTIRKRPLRIHSSERERAVDDDKDADEICDFINYNFGF